MKKSLLLIFALPLTTLVAKPFSSEIVRSSAEEIDKILLQGQKKRKVQPTSVADDATFLRRSYLNIVGRIPTEQEARDFLNTSEPDKRSNLVDSLVESPGFESRMFNFWADLLRLQTRSEHHGLGWHVWLKEAVESDMPYNQMVREMLAADGHVARNPAAGYYLRDRGMLLDNVSNTVQVFLGEQIGCAQCHDHPFDDTTQMEYYQLAAFLGGTTYRFEEGRERIKEVVGINAPAERMDAMNQQARNKGKKSRLNKNQRQNLQLRQRRIARQKQAEARDLGTVFRYHNRNSLSDVSSKELKLPEDYQYKDGKPGDKVEPGLLFRMKAGDVPPEKRREVFSDWVTSDENPQFAKVIANRLWEYAFGYGLVADPDDWENSPDTFYPELVDHLEKVMKASNYDVRQFLRILYQTQLFQREVAAEEPAQGFSFDFQGPVLRRLEANEIRDSFITLASGNIDENRNDRFSESWNEYVKSFDYLMSANAKQLREIDKAVDDAEVARRALQKQRSLLRTEFRVAKESGDREALRKLEKKNRELRSKEGRRYGRAMEGSETIEKAQAALSRNFRNLRPGMREFMLRTSELAQPQRGGSFIAEFGGSDAESPSSSHTEATVPQSLRLLNGLETSLLTDRKNRFARTLRELDSPEQRLDFLFLSLYSAYPTEEEKEAFLPEVETSTATFARAIITSNRFLFVQ